jgi:MAPEG family
VDGAALPNQQGPILVTLTYVFVYYALQVHGLRVKQRLGREYRQRGERFDRYFGQDRTLLAADRYVLNTLEHMPAFLCLLWLHAVFAGPLGATVAGGIYVATRIAYPFLVGPRLERLPGRVLVATFTGYAVLIYLGVAVGRAAFR